jgi:hypothetical protein
VGYFNDYQQYLETNILSLGHFTWDKNKIVKSILSGTKVTLDQIKKHFESKSVKKGVLPGINIDSAIKESLFEKPAIPSECFQKPVNQLEIVPLKLI